MAKREWSDEIDFDRLGDTSETILAIHDMWDDVMHCRKTDAGKFYDTIQRLLDLVEQMTEVVD